MRKSVNKKKSKLGSFNDWENNPAMLWEESKVARVSIPLDKVPEGIPQQVAQLINKSMGVSSQEETMKEEPKFPEGSQSFLKQVQDSILPIIFQQKDYCGLFSQFIKDSEQHTVKTVCGRVLKKNDIGYQCLDCQKDSTAIICQQCFDHSNHKGHRIKAKNSVSGLCDCGDKEAWAEEGFCTEHKGFANIQINYDTILPILKKNLPETFRWLFTCIFYYCESFYDFVIAQEVSQIEEEDDPVITRVRDTLHSIMDLLRFFSSANVHMGYFMSREFMIAKSSGILSRIDPTNVKRNIFGNEWKVYDGSPLELFFRLNCFFNQKALTEMLLSCFFVDYEFKKSLISTYTKFFNFIIEVHSENNEELSPSAGDEGLKKNRMEIEEVSESESNAGGNEMTNQELLISLLLQRAGGGRTSEAAAGGAKGKPKKSASDKNKDMIVISAIRDLDVQLFTAEELTVVGVESGYFDNIIDVTLKIMALWINDVESVDYWIYYQVFSHFFHSSWKKSSCLALIKQHTSLMKYFQLLANLQYIISFYPSPLYDDKAKGPMKIPYDNSNKLFEWVEIELFTMKVVKKIIRFSKDLSNCKDLLKTYIKKVVALILNFRNIQMKATRGTVMVSIHLPLQRAFTHLVLGYCETVSGVTSTENLRAFLVNEIFDGDLKTFNTFVRYNVLEVTKVFGFVKLVQRELLGPVCQNKLQHYTTFYFLSKLRFFDFDMVTVQLLLQFVEPSEIFTLVQSGFGNLSRAYLDHIDKFQNGEVGTPRGGNEEPKPWNAKLIEALFEESLQFIAFLCVDEMSLVHCMSKFDPDQAKEGGGPQSLNTSGSKSMEETKDMSKSHEDESGFSDKVVKKSLGTVLLGMPSVQMKDLRKAINQNILAEDINFDQHLQELASFDNNTKLIRRNPLACAKAYDPFLLYRDIILFNQIHDEVIKLCNSKSDLQSGAVDPHLGNASAIQVVGCTYLTKIRNHFLLDGNLLTMIINCLEQKGKNGGNLLIYLLKITQIMCATTEEILTLSPSNADPAFIPMLHKTLLHTSFIEILKEVSASPNVKKQFDKIETSIMKIMIQINDIQGALNKDKIGMFQPNKLGDDMRIDSLSKDLQNKERSRKRQEELRKKMMEKQSIFMKKAQEEDNTMADEQSKEQDSCCLCHDEIVKGGKETYGVVGYISRSNLVYLAAFQKHMQMCLNETVNKLNSKVDELSDMSKWNLKGKGYSVVTSCYHVIHYKCYQKQLSSEDGLAMHQQYAALLRGETEFFCCVCRNLCNIFIPMDLVGTSGSQAEKMSSELKGDQMIQEQPNDKPSLKIDYENLPKALDYIDKTVEESLQGGKNRMEEEVKGSELITEGGDSMMLNDVVRSMTEQNERSIDLFQDTCEAIVNGFKSMELVGFTNFLTKDFTLLRAYLQQFLDVLHFPNGVFAKGFASDIKKTLQGCKDDLQRMLADPNLLTENNIDTFYLNLTWKFYFWYSHIMELKRGGEKMKSTADVLLNDFKSVLRGSTLYLATLKFLQIFLVNEHITAGIRGIILDPAYITGRMKSFDIKNADKVNVELLKAYTRYLKIVTASWLCFSDLDLLPSKTIIEDLKKKPIFGDTDIEEYLALSDLLDLSIEKSVIPLLLSSPKLLEVQLGGYSKYLLANEFNVPYNFLFLYAGDSSFSLVNLADNYADLHAGYIDKKCELCNSHTNAGTRCICLLCGMSLCSIACRKEDITNPVTHVGNLTKHAQSYHAGNSIFFDLSNTMVYALSGSKCAIDKPLYVDDYGQPFMFKSNWLKYKLDDMYLSTIRSNIIANKIPQMTINICLATNRKCRDNHL